MVCTPVYCSLHLVPLCAFRLLRVESRETVFFHFVSLSFTGTCMLPVCVVNSFGQLLASVFRLEALLAPLCCLLPLLRRLNNSLRSSVVSGDCFPCFWALVPFSSWVFGLLLPHARPRSPSTLPCFPLHFVACGSAASLRHTRFGSPLSSQALCLRFNFSLMHILTFMFHLSLRRAAFLRPVSHAASRYPGSRPLALSLCPFGSPIWGMGGDDVEDFRNAKEIGIS